MIVTRRTRFVGLRAATAAVLALGALTSGCGDGGPLGGGDEPDWSVATQAPAFPGDGLIWALGSDVHLGDDSEVEAGQEVSEFVVTDTGLFTIGSDRTLRFLDAESEETDLGIEADGLALSPDGRYFATVDFSSGEQDRYGTPQAETVVVDLTTGEEVLRSPEGMGDPGEDDFTALYSEYSFSLWFTDEQTLVVQATEPVEIDLADGSAEVLDSEPTNPAEAVYRLESPDGESTIYSPGGFQDQVTTPDGTVTPRPGTERWNLEWWVDDDTVAGYAIAGPLEDGDLQGDDTQVTLMTCEIPAGDCDLKPESTNERGVVFPTGSRGSAYTLDNRQLED